MKEIDELIADANKFSINILTNLIKKDLMNYLIFLLE